MSELLPNNPCWDAFRARMPITRDWAYFDHAAVSPLPAPTAAAVASWARGMSEQGESLWPQGKARVEQLRGMAARLIGVHAEEIALVRSTTEGINIVAEGFRWQPGDNVVTLADEFPANLYPWMNQASRGVETRRVPTDGGRVDLNRLADACDSRTRIVTISWVSYSSGWRNDLAALADMAHRRGRCSSSMRFRDWACFPSTRTNWGSISSPPAAKSGCSVRRGPESFISAASISTASTRSASATPAWCMPPTTRGSKST